MTVIINCLEKDIEDFLSDNKNLEEYLGLKFLNRQYQINKFFIDILAYNKFEKCFYIIELKKTNLDANALVQALRYQRLLRIKYKNKHKFKILLIGSSLCEELFYCIHSYSLIEENEDICYTLYHFDLKDGISFNYINREQKNIEKELEEELRERSLCQKDL